MVTNSARNYGDVSYASEEAQRSQLAAQTSRKHSSTLNKNASLTGSKRPSFDPELAC